MSNKGRFVTESGDIVLEDDIENAPGYPVKKIARSKKKEKRKEKTNTSSDRL